MQIDVINLSEQMTALHTTANPAVALLSSWRLKHRFPMALASEPSVEPSPDYIDTRCRQDIRNGAVNLTIHFLRDFDIVFAVLTALCFPS
jgi:hypothetical protein